MIRFVFLGLTAAALLTSSARAADYKLETVDKLPEKAPAEVGQVLAPAGHRVSGPEGPLCSVWFVKTPAVKADFKSTLSVKYPLQPGGLVGLLQVEKGTEFTDFREQVIAPGLYTLRYAQQPQDGNHIGTSEVADFLAAIPADDDSSVKPIEDRDEISARSKEAAGSTHPAILSLRPTTGAKPGEPKLIYDSTDDLWVLETSVGSEKPVVLRVVVVGFAFE